MKTKLFMVLFFLVSVTIWGQGLKTSGQKIVDENDNEVLLKGMGLGGWMLMEGYMMKSSDGADTQHEFKSKVIELMGVDKTNEFYAAWLENHVTKKDIDSLAKWGYNSVRLPMHYNLFTLPIEDEPVLGENTWLDKGFTMTDNLLQWCEENNMYLILDLHGAPGGQGTNAAISDYDESKPSLWQDSFNKSKTVALWRKLADRYKDEEWIGGYDLLNEVNGDHVTGSQLKDFYIEITNAIREVDTKHILFIEGHDWANNFTGITPAWDDNMVYSFHKYWSKNDIGSIQWVLDLREQQNVPLWMGEAGENSNVWFTEAITLFEDNNIGWSWWPMKRIETIVSPYSIKFTEGYKNILEYWKGNGAKPSVNDTYTALMELANNTNSENCDYQKDVPDAMLRQTQTDETIRYSSHTIPGVVHMSDFDLGKNGFAYFDQDYANYQLSTGEFQAWNDGWVYRNDGIDIQASSDAINNNGYHIGFIKKDEWMNYTLEVDESAIYKAEVRIAAQNNGGKFHLSVDDEEVTTIQTITATGGWETFAMHEISDILLEEGTHVLKFYMDGVGEFNISSIEFTKIGETSESTFKTLNGHTATNKSIEVVVNQSILESSLNDSKDSFSLYINNTEVPISSISFNTLNNRSIVLNTDKTIIYTDNIKVNYSGTVIKSQTGNTLDTFSNLEIRNTLTPLFIIPGTIEVEDFVDMFGLATESTTDEGGGYNIGYTNAGDYADYIIYSESTSNYNVDFRFAGFNAGEIGLYLVDESSTETELVKITTPETGGWQIWETVSGTVNISEGIHTLRLKVLGGEFNMNWMQFEELAGNDDSDGDGILNENDDCPNTEVGAAIDGNGCAIFTLPIDNFIIGAYGESCPGKENGKIEVAAEEAYNYKMTLIGNGISITRFFTVGITLGGIKPGTYDVCITVEGEEFKQCFKLEIAEGFKFSGKSSVSGKTASIEIEKGTAPFKVLINGSEVLETMFNSFEIDVKHGDLLEVKTAIVCEGKLESKINLFKTITSYPNPSKGEFVIAIPSNHKRVMIEIYNTLGQLIEKNEYEVNSGRIIANLSNSPKGIYMVKLYLEEPVTLKLIKD